MAKQSVSSCVDVYWVDSADKINANFTELYAKAGATTTSTAAELNLNDGVPASVTTTATPASGSVGVQFVFKQADGTTSVTSSFSGIGYIATAADGLTLKAVGTSVAALTNGRVTELVAGHNIFHYTTTAAGLLGLTITAVAGDYYVIFTNPNGKIIASTVCTVNA